MCYYSILQLQSKYQDSLFVSCSKDMPTKNAKSLTLLFRGDSEIWGRQGQVQQDSRCYHSILHHWLKYYASWFVSSSTLVPTKNAKSLTPLCRGDSEIWERQGQVQQDRRCYHSIVQHYPKYCAQLVYLLFHSCVPKKCEIIDTLFGRWGYWQRDSEVRRIGEGQVQ